MLDKLNSIKEHIYNHRGRYCAAVTAAAALWFITSRAKVWNEFLTEHGLYDAFYNADEM